MQKQEGSRDSSIFILCICLLIDGDKFLSSTAHKNRVTLNIRTILPSTIQSFREPRLPWVEIRNEPKGKIKMLSRREMMHGLLVALSVGLSALWTPAAQGAGRSQVRGEGFAGSEIPSRSNNRGSESRKDSSSSNNRPAIFARAVSGLSSSLIS